MLTLILKNCMNIKLPPYLKKGDTIGITCPAGFMAAEKAQTCIANIAIMGLRGNGGQNAGQRV